MSLHQTGFTKSCLVYGLVTFVALMAVPTIRAQDDLLDLTRKKNTIAAQKLIGEVDKALDEVRSVMRSNPKQALGILKAYQAIVEKDEALQPQQKDQLLQSIRSQLALVERLPQTQTPIRPTQPQPLSKEELRDKYLQNVPQQRVYGDDRGGVSKVAQDFYNKNKSIVTKQNNIKREQELGFEGVLGSVERSSVPVTRDVEFPKYWSALVKARPVGPKLTKEEAFALKTLNSVMTVDFDRAPLKDAISYITERTNMPIVIDGQSLREANVEYDTPVTFRPGGKVSVRTILKSMLREVGLSYIIKEGTIQVVTPQVARETMVTRSYSITDLMPVPDQRFGPLYNRYQQLYFANQIINMIYTTVEPSTWAPSGGRGTIFFHEPSMSLVVRNSAELHLSLSQSFGR